MLWSLHWPGRPSPLMTTLCLLLPPRGGLNEDHGDDAFASATAEAVAGGRMEGKEGKVLETQVVRVASEAEKVGGPGCSGL